MRLRRQGAAQTVGSTFGHAFGNLPRHPELRLSSQLVGIEPLSLPTWAKALRRCFGVPLVALTWTKGGRRRRLWSAVWMMKAASDHLGSALWRDEDIASRPSLGWQGQSQVHILCSEGLGHGDEHTFPDL